eukprot:9491114-Pyramimonas_sp.AAC.1
MQLPLLIAVSRFDTLPVLLAESLFYTPPIIDSSASFGLTSIDSSVLFGRSKKKECAVSSIAVPAVLTHPLVIAASRSQTHL